MNFPKIDTDNAFSMRENFNTLNFVSHFSDVWAKQMLQRVFG